MSIISYVPILLAASMSHQMWQTAALICMINCIPLQFSLLPTGYPLITTIVQQHYPMPGAYSICTLYVHKLYIVHLLKSSHCYTTMSVTYIPIYYILQSTQPWSHPPLSQKELLQLHQWVSPGPKCWMLQDTMWAIRDRTLELPQWWLHSTRGLWEGPPLVSHWVVWNQEQPTGSECGLQMGHQSVVEQGRWMWQQWKVVRGAMSMCAWCSYLRNNHARI